MFLVCLHIGLQVNEIVLLRLDEGGGLLTLLLQLVLRDHQIALKLVKTCIVHIAQFHFRERCHLTHIFRVTTSRVLVKDGKFGLLLSVSVAIYELYFRC